MRPPDFSAVYKAWAVKMPPPGERKYTSWDAQLGAYIVEVPGFNAFWSWYFVGLVHLRDIPGAPPPVKQYEKAEYEMLIYALDPAKLPDPDHPENGFAFLAPSNLAYQFDGVTDEEAASLLHLFVKAMVRNHFTPDTDHRRLQIEALDANVLHIRAGKHSVS